MAKAKTYRIYRLEQEGDTVFKFYLPEEDTDMKTALRRKATRLQELHELKKKGYVITADILTDKEGYLNGRLSVAVADYLHYSKAERNLRLFSYRYSRQTFCQGMESILDSKRSAQKRVASLVRRLRKDDLEVHNDMALMILDLYERELCDKVVEW